MSQNIMTTTVATRYFLLVTFYLLIVIFYSLLLFINFYYLTAKFWKLNDLNKVNINKYASNLYIYFKIYFSSQKINFRSPKTAVKLYGKTYI